MDSLKFEWDEDKNELNKQKHKISFETAKEVFYDELAILFDDPDHSIGEERFLIMGMLKSSKICIVSHCYRDKENVIRIISAREATKPEKRFYEEGR
ncbi:MAG: BrnT family toxin [Ruminococcus sp.]|nr:BrnT family toxin [Ruminococcus sp.]